MSAHNNKNINGWIILDKPQGVSSNQILRQIQYLLCAKKAGHIGTLDPFATGVLPLAFGEATKLIPYLEGGEKTYEFTLKFGQATSTDDTEGTITAVSKKIPSPAEINDIIPRFCGNITQIPPKYSAVHVNGVRAYDLARAGTEFTLPSRTITIKELTFINFNSETASADFRVVCSKGTYVRTLGKDIALALGSLGHLTALRRIKNGFFSLSETILLDNLKNMLYKNPDKFSVFPVETFLCDITVIALTEDEALKLKSGQPIDVKDFHLNNTPVAACFEGKLIAIVGMKQNKFFPIRVFNL